MYNYYNKRIALVSSELKSLERRFFLFYIFRLLSFISFISFTFWFFASGELWQAAASAAFFIFFIFVVKTDLKWVKQQRLLKSRLLVNQNELRYLEYDYFDFDQGEEFVKLNPHLAGDFDLFGRGSLFQYLSRSVLHGGRKKLAASLSFQNLDVNIISNRQKAIKELSENPMFLEDFQALALQSKETGKERENLHLWLNSSVSSLISSWILGIYPFAVFLFLVLVYFSVVPGSVLILILFLAFGIIFSKKKIVDQVHNQLGKSARNLEVYEQLICLIEKQTFSCSYLKELQSIFIDKTSGASLCLRQLYKLLERFDYRYNFIAAIILNILALFDLQMVRLLGKWKSKYKNEVISWLDTLDEFDAMSGFARFAMNNESNVCTAELSEKEFEFSAKHLAHPLISAKNRISNNVYFSGQPKVLVITGANMAGKSTFLRTLAVNIILAINGAPAVARYFKFSPCFIMSSINIRDSLSQKASYFYSELIRIRQIIDYIKDNPKTMVILDEILRGTNTRDKQAGSIGLIDKLIAMNAVVVIATHDLTIGDLDKKYPRIVSNHCFEVELDNDQLVFDYKLKEGVSQKLNASFLMRKMGVID